MKPSEDNPGAHVKKEVKKEKKEEFDELPNIKHEGVNIKSEPDKLAHGEDIDSDDGTLGGLEDKLVAAYRNAQKAVKKPKTAKAAKSVGTNKVIKRPASAPKSVVKKRPAGVQKSNLDMTHIFARLRNRKPLPGYASFTSCAYHPARNLALKAGYSEAEAKDIARQAFEKAAKLHAQLR